MLFTKEELAEMARADAEIEANFRMTDKDYKESRERDALLFPRTVKQRKAAAYQKAYYEANREGIAAKQKAYYEANREEIAAYQKAYREANREEIAAYQKAYREANREEIAARH